MKYKFRSLRACLFRIAVAAIGACPLVSEAGFASTPDDAASPKLTRGVNIYPYMWPHLLSAKSTVYRKPEFDISSYPVSFSEFSALRSAGFDFIRLPISPGPFIEAPSEIPELVSQVERGMQPALSAGLAVIVDVHPPGSGDQDSYPEIVGDKQKRSIYLSLLGALAAMLERYPTNHVALELMNEPSGDCADTTWQELRAQAYLVSRRHAPNLYLVLTGACASDFSGLILVSPKDFDSKTYFTFHYYEPGIFTHQGATWVSNEVLRHARGIRWPSSIGNVTDSIGATLRAVEQDRALSPFSRLSVTTQAVREITGYYSTSYGKEDIEADFGTVEKWASQNRLQPSRVLLGEFGVLKQEDTYQGADMQSAAAWLRSVRIAAEADRFPWCMWTYGQGMALIKDPVTRTPFPELIRALGLKVQ